MREKERERERERHSSEACVECYEVSARNVPQHGLFTCHRVEEEEEKEEEKEEVEEEEEEKEEEEERRKREKITMVGVDTFLFYITSIYLILYFSRIIFYTQISVFIPCFSYRILYSFILFNF